MNFRINIDLEYKRNLTLVFLAVSMAVMPFILTFNAENAESKITSVAVLRCLPFGGLSYFFIGYYTVTRYFHLNSVFTYLFVLLCSCVSMIGFYAFAFTNLGIVDTANGETTSEPIDAIYFSIVTWITLGYGDFRPTESARMIAASEAFVGYVTMALFVGSLLFHSTRPTKRAKTRSKRSLQHRTAPVQARSPL